MGRRKARRRAETSPQQAEGATRLGQLEELRAVRRTLKTARSSPDKNAAADNEGDASRPRPRRQPPSDKRDTDLDADLFRSEMRGAKPLRDTGHTVLESPKPAPIPRRRARSDDAEDSIPQRRHRAPQNDSELFRMMMDDVTPLEENNQADLDTVRPPPNPRDEQSKPTPEGKLLPTLPEDADAISDAELFRLVVGGSKRLDTTDRVELRTPPPPPKAAKRQEDDAAVLRETLETPLTLEDRLDSGEEDAFLRNGLPRRVLIDLRRGRWALQGEVDLHGFTRDEARAALATFLMQSLQRGRRCVRVIHGKGHGSPGRVSILKQLSRGWLAQREEILAFCQAGPNQGGSGALMVLLRAQNRMRS